jgi:NAD(P)-dependent dehydrogenase (short-subunit alcohol dehydrogenase family)
VLPPPEPSGTKEPAGAIPLGTRPAAEHVAAAVRFLLDAESVTGQVLFVDGGQHLTS